MDEFVKVQSLDVRWFILRGDDAALQRAIFSPRSL